MKLISKAEANTRYRLTERTTPEELGIRHGVTFPHGEHQIFAGAYWQGPGQPEAYAVIYENIDEEPLAAESEIAMIAATDVCFGDVGHAIEWAVRYITE